MDLLGQAREIGHGVMGEYLYAQQAGLGALAPLTEQLQSMSQDIAAHAAKTAGRRQRQHAVSRSARALTGEGVTSP